MIVLDTHALIWWVNGTDDLSTSAKRAINKALSNDEEVIVSSITAWEIAMLISHGRLVLSMDVDTWLNEVAQIDGVSFLPIDNEIGVKSTILPGEFHKDPADRMIVATARKLSAPLVTADKKIRDYPHVKTIW